MKEGILGVCFFFKFNYISKNCLRFYSVIITQRLLWWPRAYVLLRRCKCSDLINPKNMQTSMTFSSAELCLQSSSERWRTGQKKHINYSNTTLFILLCSGHNSKGHNPKAALKHTAKTVTAINNLARSVWKEIPLWGYTNRGYDYMAFIDATLVKSEGFLSSTSRRWFYMLNQPKSRWQGPTEAHLYTAFVFSH